MKVAANDDDELNKRKARAENKAFAEKKALAEFEMATEALGEYVIPCIERIGAGFPQVNIWSVVLAIAMGVALSAGRVTQDQLVELVRYTARMVEKEAGAGPDSEAQ